jgi:Holliday junction resolvase-like predicted endonuclease
MRVNSPDRKSVNARKFDHEMCIACEKVIAVGAFSILENVLWRILQLTTQAGRAGERCVEDWLTGLGWSCEEKNLRIAGGEIDRLFVRCNAENEGQTDVCVAEIKTTKIKSRRQFRELFCEARMRPLIRPLQIRNLWRTAALYEARLRSRRKHVQLRIYVRYFLVVKSSEAVVRGLGAAFRNGDFPAPLRLCRASGCELILSWAPDSPSQKL